MSVHKSQTAQISKRMANYTKFADGKFALASNPNIRYAEIERSAKATTNMGVLPGQLNNEVNGRVN